MRLTGTSAITDFFNVSSSVVKKSSCFVLLGTRVSSFALLKKFFLIIIYSLFSIFAASDAILLKVAFLTEDRPDQAFATAPVAKNWTCVSPPVTAGPGTPGAGRKLLLLSSEAKKEGTFTSHFTLVPEVSSRPSYPFLIYKSEDWLIPYGNFQVLN